MLYSNNLISKLNEQIMTTCPCCSRKEYQRCCEPLLLGKQLAQTPEQLMRSRYTAFTQRNIDYIFATMTGPALASTSREETQAFVDHVIWTGLEVVNTSQISPLDQKGFVEFSAYYIEDNQAQVLSERSKFIKKSELDGKNEQWFYIGGKHKLISPEQAAKISNPGRNEPCFCGSGIKYKKCCLK